MKSKFPENLLAFGFLVTWFSTGGGFQDPEISVTLEPKETWRVTGEGNSPGPKTSSGYGFVFRIYSVIGHGSGKGVSS